MSEAQQRYAPGEWFGVLHPAEELTEVEIAISEEAPLQRDWKPAFHEAGRALIRTPDLPSGWYSVWIRVAGGHAQRSGSVFVGG